jgi:radical SAM protein with 4Fe4S-binding SPASM domain
LRLELAKTCLEDAHEGTRKAGVALLTEEESPEADFLLVKSMADASEAVWRKARDVLIHRSPWLVLEPSWVRPVPESALANRHGRAWASLRRGIGRVVREAEPNLDLLQRWATIPGAVPDVIEELQQSGLDTLARTMAKLAGDRCTRTSGNRQILLAPTYRCNLTCSYCYAKNFSNGFPPDMSLEDLALAFSWAATQGVDHILLAGGEPTIYSHFPELLRMAKAHGMAVLLTSNCLYSASLREHIAAPALRELVAHYDQERMAIAQSAPELFLNNLRAARERGVTVMLRYTLTEQSGSSEWLPMMELAQQLSIQQINYALAFQGSEGRNAYFKSRNAVGAAGGGLEDLLTGLCGDAANKGLRLHLSKPFPLCALTADSLRRMFRDGAVGSACAAYLDQCTRNLTINPDLSTFPCNGIAIRGPKITELSSLADAGRHHAPAIRDLISQPYDEQCRQCALWYRGFCQGACLAEHYWMSRDGKGCREGQD